jgi:predicted homoserine dehydrogenase-like protein
VEKARKAGVFYFLVYGDQPDLIAENDYRGQRLCDLQPPEEGLGSPACGVNDLPQILRLKSAGGILEHKGMVGVISSLERDI